MVNTRSSSTNHDSEAQPSSSEHLAVIAAKLATLDELKEKVSALEAQSARHPRKTNRNQHISDETEDDFEYHKTRPYAKVEFPRFDGGDPRGWVLKAEKYFRYYDIPEEDKVDVAAMYLEGDALDLFSWMNTERSVLYWDELVKAFQEHYGPPEYQNPDEHLASIKQTGSEITTSLIAICVSTESIIYMISYGLSAAASTRVSNELGADNPERAKLAMGVTLKLSILLAVCIVTALSFGHSFWSQLFSDSSVIKQEFASMTPLLATSILLDSVQSILSGVARGCGWQHLVVYINLATFYIIGLPISYVLGFKTTLHVKGLWIG